jgi:hypothetical protein
MRVTPGGSDFHSSIVASVTFLGRIHGSLPGFPHGWTGIVHEASNPTGLCAKHKLLLKVHGCPDIALSLFCRKKETEAQRPEGPAQEHRRCKRESKWHSGSCTSALTHSLM